MHKFGGTCVGSAERIWLLRPPHRQREGGTKTFGIVSAMGVANKGESKVTDCLINATTMAANGDAAYLEELVKLEHKHQTTAEALLTTPAEYDDYMSAFATELEDLRAMLKAMAIARTSTQAPRRTFGRRPRKSCGPSARCARHDRMQGPFDAAWIDARDVLVVTDAEDGGVDVDYDRSNANLDALFDACGHGAAGAGRVLIATG